jgi:putative hydrolase of the HAD superfamily
VSAAPSGPIRAVYFDAVGTLLHPRPSAVDVYHVVGREFGSRLDRDTIATRFREAFAGQELLDRQTGLTTSEEREVLRWRAIVARVLDDVARPEECFQRLYSHFARPEAWAVDAEAEQTLTCLAKRGLRLGICSNFDHRLRGILAGLPQLSRLEDAVISSEVGWRKPGGEFFARLREQAGLPAGEILIVGDDLDNDYRGARQAGLHALLLDPRGRCEGLAEERVGRLAEVLGWLERNCCSGNECSSGMRDARP